MTIIETVVLDTKTLVESPFNAAKLQSFLKVLSSDLDARFVHLPSIVEKITNGLPAKLTKDELMDLTSETIASLTTKHYHHSILASKTLASYHQKRLPRKFSKNVELLLSQKTKGKGLITKRIGKLVELHKERIDLVIDHERDYLLDYFGLKTLMRSYLLKFNGELLETPQYLFMRVSLGIHDDDIDAALETYELMSKKYFIHASPTLFYSGTDLPSLSSCFLVAMKDDSIDGIFKTVHQTALISKCAGGVGLHVSNIRASGSYISGTNGTSSGLVPMLRVFNATAKYVDQGGNKRPGAFCIYLEPWHADIFEFLELRKNHGKEEVKARDLFYALWISDIFMEKVQKAEDWCLFSEDSCPGLTDTYGDEFVKLYNKYEAEGKYVQKMHVMRNQIRRILEPSNHPTCVVKLWSIQMIMRLLSAI
ncbi:unnamed protein product [Ambrosiozyma monospora]|uniref:Ribonucleoside-diphosphate reductase n=1 Tax=Ambrosiozyma monospora TaxID=43982 RepID=A0A9W7DNR2_AMBMO|nr:unnamed protein product [Ambrosiozyma monospora]